MFAGLGRREIAGEGNFQLSECGAKSHIGRSDNSDGRGLLQIGGVAER